MSRSPVSSRSEPIILPPSSCLPLLIFLSLLTNPPCSPQLSAINALSFSFFFFCKVSLSCPRFLSLFRLLYPPSTHFLASALSLQFSLLISLLLCLSLFLSIPKSSRDPSFLSSYLDFSLSLSIALLSQDFFMLSLNPSLSLVLALFLSLTYMWDTKRESKFIKGKYKGWCFEGGML